MKASRAAGWCTGIVTAAILYLTLFPNPLPDGGPQLFPGADKVVHAIMFGALTAALIVDYRLIRHHAPSMSVLLAMAAAASLLGGAIEILQGTMNLGRTADILDFAADTAGAFLIAFLSRLISRR